MGLGPSKPVVIVPTTPKPRKPIVEKELTS